MVFFLDVYDRAPELLESLACWTGDENVKRYLINDILCNAKDVSLREKLQPADAGHVLEQLASYPMHPMLLDDSLDGTPFVMENLADLIDPELDGVPLVLPWLSE